jgi:Rps23 Pro-64 3,4-dihydroxylase Tpa1-like proline 4-hydroxylase
MIEREASMAEMIHPHRASPLSQPTASSERLSREVMAECIAQRIEQSETDLARQWRESLPINHFVLDDLLPVGWAESIRRAFPSAGSMFLKRSLRELKYVAAQMDRYDPLLEEAIYAFQAPRIVSAIERITGLRDMEPDELLYAGGISLMAPGHFLNPHIDNSHDRFRKRYRILNLLYYVSPQWPGDRGGNLELWPTGLRGSPATIVSKFNRLVVMLTHKGSWHSVSKNLTTEDRCCVSNYFFSRNPIGGADYYHVTEFRGRPEQPLRDMVLRGDNWLRTVIRTKFPKAFRNPHFYDQVATPTLPAGTRSDARGGD